MSEILQPNVPRKFEGRNIRTPKRSGATNDLYLVQFEITREAWESLETIPKTALLEGVIWFHDGDPIEQTNGKPAKEKKAKKERGPWGSFWKKMFAHHATDKEQFFNHPDLHTVLNLVAPVTLEQAKGALHEAFDVDSMTFISPTQFTEWCIANELHSLATLAQRIAFE
jgi:hypothetical protein